MIHHQARSKAYNQLRLFEPGGPCVECGATTDLTWDHKTPLGRGGGTTWSNLQCLCRRCNSAKRDRRDDA